MYTRSGSDHGELFGFDQFEFEGGTYIRLRLKFDPPELYEKKSVQLISY